MPSKTAPPPKATSARPTENNFDDYLLEGDLSDNPFGSPPPGGNGNPNASNKRKSPGGGGLGIDEEVEVKKRVAVPRVKLDEARLLSQNGIPKLRQRAKHLRLKGKGHEWSDASKVLSFYQIWLDDLFPKAQFLDALAMVEKAGHKGVMHKARVDWIDEGKPRDRTWEDDGGDDAFGDKEGEKERVPSRIAPVFEQAKKNGAGGGGADRPGTPERGEDLFGDEDIYDATPKAARNTAAAADGSGGGEPDEEDDLDALMAEAESSSAPARLRSIFGGAPGGKTAGSSLFGGPMLAKTSAAADEPDEDDLDALMAEAEAGVSSGKLAPTSIFGGGKEKAPVMVDEADDDLNALMAEAEAGGSSAEPTAKAYATEGADGDGGPKDTFGEDEEAMAEMEGLW